MEREKDIHTYIENTYICVHWHVDILILYWVSRTTWAHRRKPILHYCAIVVVMIKNNRILSINFRLAFLSSSFSFLLPFVFFTITVLRYYLYSIQFNTASCPRPEYYGWSFATKTATQVEHQQQKQIIYWFFWFLLCGSWVVLLL